MRAEHSICSRSPASEPVFADADELRVLQIARILVENALVHTPSGTAVQVRARHHDGRAALEVQDDSAGIPEDQRDQLFERFYRLEGTAPPAAGSVSRLRRSWPS